MITASNQADAPPDDPDHITLQDTANLSQWTYLPSCPLPGESESSRRPVQAAKSPLKHALLGTNLALFEVLRKRPDNEGGTLTREFCSRGSVFLDVSKPEERRLLRPTYLTLALNDGARRQDRRSP